MSDGKPLVLSMAEREGTLFLSFVKSHEGLWAEGTGVICMRGTKLEVRFHPDTLVVGSTANWALRYSLGHGASFSLSRLDALRMKVSTIGWTGTFTAE